MGAGSGRVRVQDVSSPITNYQRQSQFAAGGLVGYNFGPVRLQAYATSDVYVRNYSGHDTRVWGRVTGPFPVSSAVSPASDPVARRYYQR
jgi:hypothetical protein